MSLNSAIYFFNRGYSSVDGAADLLAGEGAIARAWRAILGEKGASLHAMSALGFRVPAGFTVPAAWCEAFLQGGRKSSVESRDRLERAMSRLERTVNRKLGDAELPLLVAVRAGTAGRRSGTTRSVLNLRSLDELEAAMERALLGRPGDATAAARAPDGRVTPGGVAVTVQEMCPAEAVGVVFTADPETEQAPVVLEAVGGSGVGGGATPDRYRLARPGLEMDYCVFSGNSALLSREQARSVAEQALELAARSGSPLHVEWALAGGRVHLLDARPVRTRGSARAVKELLLGDAERLRVFLTGGVEPPGGAKDAAADDGVVRCDLDEAVSRPTPMTWDVSGELFSGRGAYVGSCLDLGFRPSRRVLDDGFLVLLGGHVYAGSSRAAELFGRGDGPVRSVGKRDGPVPFPDSTLRPSARCRPRVGRARHLTPATFFRRVLPDYITWCRTKRRQLLAELRLAELMSELDQRIDRVFHSFVRSALTLSFLAGSAREDLLDVLERRLGSEAGGVTLDLLLSDLEGRVRVEERRAMAGVARGDVAIDEFLEEYGHVGAGSLELAWPRRWEDIEASRRMIQTLDLEAIDRDEARLRERERVAEDERTRLERLLVAQLGPRAVDELGAKLDRARALLAWREEWRHYWMRGVDLVRHVLVEIDRRLGLDGMVFYLTRRELRDIVAARGRRTGKHRTLIRSRREVERMTASLDLPDFLTASRLADLAARISEDGDHRMLTTAVDGVLDSAGDSASDRASDRANDQARPAHGPRAPELARGAPRIPPEPYVPPWDAGRTCRVVIGCAALVAGGAILAVSTRGSLRLPVLDAILDWTLGELSPYSALVLVAASAAFLGSLPGLALGDRHRPGLVRKRIRWYRRQLGRLRTQALTAAVGPTGELDGDSAALDRRIRDRLRLAGAQRSLELLEPLGWTILASSIAWPWVEGRFPDVPARAGATLLAAALALALLCRRLAASIGR